ncbi:GNAT family N-acetyltransferase [Camelimonas fluminis]|uniref:GNAT family N-acetyltransferase n=1 Tax=Camelimonas fluminis TaxID=1576911 RepID=A0ABV7UIU5_9HYPH|nr:GNAT family N-acetyltransferase [Camelimonas fluminis]
MAQPPTGDGNEAGETGASDLTVRVASAIADIDAAAWDACAGEGNPFIRHAFLDALEQSGSACAETGWLPLHLAVEDAGRNLLAAAPCYLKSHSQGEYVFDHGWADAFERAGGAYYPKLQVCAPFTPVTGPRLLTRPGPRAAEARSTLAQGLVALRRQAGASSVHVTFLPHDEWRLLGDSGFLLRRDQQFHWFNDGYASFDDFLASLAARKRKAIRRERREALAADIAITRLTGAGITAEAWDAFFEFYQDTGSRKWGRPYLTRDFYHRIAASMADRVLLVMARRDGRYIAGAINFLGPDVLYGRHWGCIEDHPFLHFEVCYYQAIDYAISHGLSRVEAGAQGEHKLARGYRPVPTFSAHDIAHPGLKRAIAEFLAREGRHVDAAQAELEGMLPFRHED